MAENIRWGILGTGGIAREFAQGLSVLPDATLVAVGSRTGESADAFGNQFGVPNRHASYEALADDPDVDIIYIATPHNLHLENTLMCLEARKHVLCEKPFALNARHSQMMIETARSKGLFLMEAMWMAFMPSILKMESLIAEGAIGEPCLVKADFGFQPPYDPTSRLFNPELGGGALLDIGIYPVTFASFVFGTAPVAVNSHAYLGQTGVDEQGSYSLYYEKGIASLNTSLRAQFPNEAEVYGTGGQIRIHRNFWHSDSLTLSRHGKPDEVFHLPKVGNGYNYEAAEAMACLQAGKLESERWPLSRTLAIMELLDKLREPWGLVYPGE